VCSKRQQSEECVEAGEPDEVGGISQPGEERLQQEHSRHLGGQGPEQTAALERQCMLGLQQSAISFVLHMLTQWSSINAAFGTKKKTALIICEEMFLVQFPITPTARLHQLCAHHRWSTQAGNLPAD
jgi:hypothetical protein